MGHEIGLMITGGLLGCLVLVVVLFLVDKVAPKGESDEPQEFDLPHSSLPPKSHRTMWDRPDPPARGN